MASMSPVLVQHLVDDAAVFPPGNAPLAEAVRLHRLHRTSGYAACVGPLLVPVGEAAEVVRLAADGPEPLRIGLVARPGVPVTDVAEALAAVRGSTDVVVSGVELGWAPGWRDVDLGGVARTVVEVPRGDALEAAVADLAGDSSGEAGLQAKFRTGATDTWAWPDERELAVFVRTVVDSRVPFKLTGGLHHVVRGTHVVPGSNVPGSNVPGRHDEQEQHGLLNVLLTVRRALDGAGVDDLVPLLAERDVGRLVPEVTRMGAADAAAVRASFTAYGCCEVTDPISELSDLHLIEEP